MLIIHKLDDFIFDLFPETKSLKDNREELENYFAEYYSYSVYKPKVKIEDGIVLTKWGYRAAEFFF